MYLSKLVFDSVKNVFYLNDTGFDYLSFLRGNFDDDPDYATNINNVFAPLNEAIARLSDLERIPYIVEEANLNEQGYIDLKEIEEREENPRNVKEVIAIGQFHNGVPDAIEFRVAGDKVFLAGKLLNGSPLFIEYKEDIPNFVRSDIPQKNPLTDDVYDVDDPEYKDVDLRKQYRITDSMCNYIIEYVQGKLQEPLEPNLANAHLSHAESYFTNIKPVGQFFRQRVVRNVYKIGG